MAKIILPQSLAAWGTPQFEDTFKREVERTDPNLLPLQQGLELTSSVAESGFTVSVIGAKAEDACIRVRAGIFYAGFIGGCSCADDPTPVDELTEYCELMFEINKLNAETQVVLRSES